MDFITEEVKTSLNLTDDQINGLKPLHETYLADQKKGWDGKANENAEKILDGAALKIAEATGVQRNQGEKVAEYILRANSGLKTDFETKKKEYEDKLKDFDGGKSQKEELDKLKGELDAAKIKLADWDSISDKASKYDETVEKLTGLKLQVAFDGVKPQFAEGTNKWESDGVWNKFKTETLSKYTIELVDNEAIAINKENEHDRKKLTDLVDKDAELTRLSQGRKQDGLNGKQKDKQKIDGVPFDVPKDATSVERTKAIQDYLATQNIVNTSPEYAKKFAEYNGL